MKGFIEKVFGALTGSVSYVKYGLVLAAIVAAFLFGHSVAKTKGDLALEQLKNKQEEAVAQAQKAAISHYDDQIKSLVVSLDRLRADNDQRVRELEAFRRSGGDLETCRRQRSDLAELAVEGERLLREAAVYFDGDRK